MDRNWLPKDDPARTLDYWVPSPAQIKKGCERARRLVPRDKDPEHPTRPKPLSYRLVPGDGLEDTQLCDSEYWQDIFRG